MKRVYNYLRDVNGMKNHSNWLGFGVKILKRVLKEDGRGLEKRLKLMKRVYNLP